MKNIVASVEQKGEYNLLSTTKQLCSLVSDPFLKKTMRQPIL